MGALVRLPKNRKVLSEAIKMLVAAGTAERNVRAADWLISYYYLHGIRNFPQINYKEGRVKFSLVNNERQRGFKYEEVMVKMSTQLGRLMRMDITPRVVRKNMSLDGVRDASIAQIVLESMFDDPQKDSLKADLLVPLLMFGTVGLAAWAAYDEETGEVVPSVEVVPPWELIPVPANPPLSRHQQGLIRSRWVPVSWLKERADLDRTISKDLIKKMETIDVNYGSLPPIEGAPLSSTGRHGTVPPKDVPDLKRMTGKGDRSERYTRLDTVWIFDETKEKVARHILVAGGEVVKDVRYDEVEGERKLPPIPIAVAKYHNVGGFYARGYVEPLLPLNSEVELMFANLFKNIQDLDLFGFMMVPATLGVDMNSFSHAKSGPKTVVFEPDYAAPDAAVFNIKPANAGTLPAKVGEAGLALMDRLSQQSEMLSGDAPGRVDSARGLGLLHEASNIPLGPAATSVATALGVVYRALLGIAEETWSNRKVGSISMLDDSVAGITFDYESGALDLSQNAIPSPFKVNVTIRSRYPESPEQKKRELIESLQGGIITPQDFRIEIRKNGIDFPVANEAEWQQYRRGTLENIQLFGDGEKPGEVIVSVYDDHMMHMMRLQDFMAKPEFSLASEAVRLKFEQHFEMHMEGSGDYPEAMGYPEEEAMLAEQMAGSGVGLPPGQLPQQGTPGGGMPQGMQSAMPQQMVS